MNKTILSIDPASIKNGTPAYAYFNNGKLIEYAELKKEKSETLTIFSRKIFKILSRISPNLVLIEGQYLGKNAQSLIKVVEGRMLWEASAYMQAIKIIQIMPAVWQSRRLGNIRMGRKRLKELSILRAKSEFKINEKVSDNVADAINIGAYYLDLHR